MREDGVTIKMVGNNEMLSFGILSPKIREVSPQENMELR